MTLLEEIAAAEATLAELKRRAAAATCEEVGHQWKQIGGRNAWCNPDCSCSAAVMQCTGCGDCDYGDPDAVEVIAHCREIRG